MNILSDVSETAIVTLKSRVQEAERENPVIHDDMAAECLEKIRSLLPRETAERLIDQKLSSSLTRHVALRARKYDAETTAFMEQYPDGLVVSLGCGFDTRYWRVVNKSWKYVEVDLPAVIEAKKEILKNKIEYLMIGCSVLEDRWIKKIAAIQNQKVLFLAEGLLMYLPQKKVEEVFRKIAETFSESRIVFEVVNKKQSQGMWKKLVELKMKRSMGSTAGSSYQFGVTDAREIETYGRNIQVLEEWSYFEDKDIEPKILGKFKNWKLMSRTQWTIKAKIG